MDHQASNTKFVNLQAMKLIIHKEGEFVEKVFRE